MMKNHAMTLARKLTRYRVVSGHTLGCDCYVGRDPVRLPDPSNAARARAGRAAAAAAEQARQRASAGYRLKAERVTPIDLLPEIPWSVASQSNIQLPGWRIRARVFVRSTAPLAPGDKYQARWLVCYIDAAPEPFGRFVGKFFTLAAGTRDPKSWQFDLLPAIHGGAYDDLFRSEVWLQGMKRAFEAFSGWRFYG